jgi:hypothetical protein
MQGAAFQMNFRLSRYTFERLLQLCGPFWKVAQTGRRFTCDLQKSLMILIWHLATGQTIRELGHLFGEARTTVWRAIVRATATVMKLVPTTIRWPDNKVCIGSFILGVLISHTSFSKNRVHTSLR